MNEMQKLREEIGMNRADFAKLFGIKPEDGYKVIWAKETNFRNISKADKVIMKHIRFLYANNLLETYIAEVDEDLAHILACHLAKELEFDSSYWNKLFEIKSEKNT